MPLLLLLAGAELNPKKSKSEEWLLALEVESPDKGRLQRFNQN